MSWAKRHPTKEGENVEINFERNIEKGKCSIPNKLTIIIVVINLKSTTNGTSYQSSWQHNHTQRFIESAG